VNQTLKLMGRSAGDRLTPEVTREVCQRTGSKAMLTGSIAGLGSQYVIGLKAVNCNTGDVLAEAQEQAAGKEAVLKALDAAAVSLRSKLGESLSSVQKYATPLEEATTPSLEALKAYSLGKDGYAKGAHARCLSSNGRWNSTRILPWPTHGHVGLYYDLNEPGRAAENARKAYELREKVSERERFSIEGSYYVDVTGELEKAAQTYELWQQTYPRDFCLTAGCLGLFPPALGNWEKALEEAREAMRLEPKTGSTISTSASPTSLNRLDEAEAVYKQAEERKLGERVPAPEPLPVGFSEGRCGADGAVGLSRHGQAGHGRRAAGHASGHGRLVREAEERARELTRRAMDSAQHNDAKETAAGIRQRQRCARWNREPGAGACRCRCGVEAGPEPRCAGMAALALARAGDTAGAEKLAAELDKTFPLDTLVQRYWLPTIRAGSPWSAKTRTGQSNC
jgi:eukaryotic-like serine/threonine-protein kinase